MRRKCDAHECGVLGVVGLAPAARNEQPDEEANVERSS
jgi:hypothetical protein